jgi:hypothetical protein
MRLAAPSVPPIANVIAASWNGGTVPDATVSSESSDHSRIAMKPMSVAREEDMWARTRACYNASS